MSMTAIGSQISTRLTTPSVTSAQGVDRTESSLASGTPPASDRGEMSKMGELLGKLSELASSDPEKFRSVTADTAAKLRELAQNATGKDQEMLSELADKFEEASETGSLPSRGRPGSAGGPPPHAPPGPPPGEASRYAQGEPKGPSSELRSKIDSVIASALGAL